MDFNYGANSQTIDFKMDVEWRNLQRLINRGLEIEVDYSTTEASSINNVTVLNTSSLGGRIPDVDVTGDQQYVLPMGMGTGMGMNGPIVPNHDILAGSSIPNPVASAAIIRKNIVVETCEIGNAIFGCNLVDNAHHELKSLKKEMKTMEVSLLRAAKKNQASYEKTDILTTFFI
ncbi:hypothetical protein Tco_0507973 [Tanacetum coccineum]